MPLSNACRTSLVNFSCPSFTWFDDRLTPTEPVHNPIRDDLMPVRPSVTWSAPLVRRRGFAGTGAADTARASQPPLALATPTAAVERARKSRREIGDMGLPPVYSNRVILVQQC